MKCFGSHAANTWSTIKTHSDNTKNDKNGDEKTRKKDKSVDKE
jgi:hypothetical protein